MNEKEHSVVDCRTCQFSFITKEKDVQCSLKNNGLKCQYKRRDLHNG